MTHHQEHKRQEQTQQRLQSERAKRGHPPGKYAHGGGRPEVRVSYRRTERALSGDQPPTFFVFCDPGTRLFFR